MKKIIRKGNDKVVKFTCQHCETIYESNEHRLEKSIEFTGTGLRTVHTYLDVCPLCGYTNVVVE